MAALLAALEYISELNQGGRELNVRGVKLSVGHPFDPAWFETGLTPVCREVDRPVRSGVVVVAAAGKCGYGHALDNTQRQMRLGFAMIIKDPGNADRAITVRSTSTRPHSTGISHYPSKGPTGDGRPKPDIVAPGERVVSAGAGDLITRARGQPALATWVEDSGTSMAAPHVSGVAAVSSQCSGSSSAAWRRSSGSLWTPPRTSRSSAPSKAWAWGGGSSSVRVSEVEFGPERVVV